ncbi:MAG: antibiotic biosynthesis monooxygenase family protein [Pseudomonadota bacterium]
MKNLIHAGTIALCLFATSAMSDDKAFAADKPVILINAFEVPAGKEAEAVQFWERAAEFMKKQPGYVSTALHQAILPDARFRLINVAKWESVDAFKKASHALRTKSGVKLVKGMVPNPSLYSIIRSD